MRKRLLSWLRVSERPDLPAGAGSSPRIFRASRRYLYYSVLMWFPKQVGTLLALVGSLAFFGSFGLPENTSEDVERVVGKLVEQNVPFVNFLLDPGLIYRVFEIVAIVSFLSQMIFTAALLKLSWDLRWYVVGEESVRIREGVWSLREQTMTIASIQNMSVRQGPIQRLIGIADLEVHTAGGGSRSEAEAAGGGDKKSSSHVGLFRGLEDAEGLRDSIYKRLMEVRGTGLGDAEPLLVSGPSVGSAEAERVAAARDLLAEARQLRLEVAGSSASAGE